MKTFQWKLDFSFVTEGEKPDPKKVFEQLILTALKLAYKEGLDMSQQRKVLKILDKLAEANGGMINLEDAEFELLQKAFEVARFPGEMTRVLNQIYDNLAQGQEAQHG